MTDSPCFPPHLASLQVPETAWAAAYETAGDGLRAQLKHTIARLFSLWGERAAKTSTSKEFAAGFVYSLESAPAPYTVVVCPAHYHYPACLLAAIMPALCAGVPFVVPLFIAQPSAGALTPTHEFAGAPVACGVAGVPTVLATTQQKSLLELPGAGVHPSLLCALELAGVETAYAVPQEQCEPVLPHFMEQYGQGRVVVLGTMDSAILALATQLAGQAAALHVPFMPLLAEPCFTPAVGLPVHGRAPFSHTGPFGCLDTSHAHTWLWPGLGPEWFCNERVWLIERGHNAS